MNKTVTPCGYLHVPGNTFYLLHPYPVAGDDWETQCHRFVVVPMEGFHFSDYGMNFDPDATKVYRSARHIVTNCFAVEYDPDIEPITIEIDKFPE